MKFNNEVKRLALMWLCVIGVTGAGIVWGLTEIKYPSYELYTADAIVGATADIVIGSATLRGIEYSSWTINAQILDIVIHNTDPVYSVYYGSSPSIVSTRRGKPGGSGMLLPMERMHVHLLKDLYMIADTNKASGNKGSTVTITVDFIKQR